jgi:hypothetical protein
MSWQAERRANRAADAEQARLDADAATERHIRERNAATDAARVDRTERREVTARKWAAVRGFVATHQVGMLIAPLAVASAVMAVPAMAAYGMDTYGNATGAVLPVLSELGMWAFALAVAVRRRTEPDVSVWALQLGIVVFAAVGFTANALHGLSRGWSAAVVMGIASIAGVVAHQFVTTSRLRTRSERQTARDERRQGRKLARVRKAAVRGAVAELDSDGAARLVFAPGRYVLARRGRLVEAIDTHVPASAALPVFGVADQVAAWLETQPVDPDSDTDGGGSVATLDRSPNRDADRDRDLRKSGQSTPRPSTRTGASIPDPSTRSMDDLRAELAAALAVEAPTIDPASAESIRRGLRCSATRARQLRDEHTDIPGA